MLERNNSNTWVQLYSGVKQPDSITPSYQISQFCGQKSAKFYQTDCHCERSQRLTPALAGGARGNLSSSWIRFLAYEMTIRRQTPQDNVGPAVELPGQCFVYSPFARARISFLSVKALISLPSRICKTRSTYCTMRKSCVTMIPARLFSWISAAKV
jgi:hypothetical protein